MPETFHVEHARNRKGRSSKCAKCDAEREHPSNSYCNFHKAEYMRAFRAKRPEKLRGLRYEKERLAQELQSIKEKFGVSA